MKLKKLKTLERILDEFDCRSRSDGAIVVKHGHQESIINRKMFSMFGKLWNVFDCKNSDRYHYKVPANESKERDWFFHKYWFEEHDMGFFKMEEFMI